MGGEKGQKSIDNYFQDFYYKRTCMRDFPDGPVVKNPPFNSGDVGSIPGQGTKIPCATG